MLILLFKSKYVRPACITPLRYCTKAWGLSSEFKDHLSVSCPAGALLPARGVGSGIRDESRLCLPKRTKRHSCDKTDQDFLLPFCILHARGRPGRPGISLAYLQQTVTWQSHDHTPGGRGGEGGFTIYLAPEWLQGVQLGSKNFIGSRWYWRKSWTSDSYHSHTAAFIPWQRANQLWVWTDIHEHYE